MKGVKILIPPRLGLLTSQAAGSNGLTQSQPPSWLQPAPAMKNINFLFGILLLLLFSATCKKKEEYICRDLENCVDGKCVLQENAYYLNNQGFKGFNLYDGVVKSNRSTYPRSGINVNPMHFYKPLTSPRSEIISI